MKKVIIIGGGPAGMSAAIAAAKNKNSVTLIEANEKLGKKLYITGKGRCNYSNGVDIKDYFDNIVSNPKFMYSALNNFTNDDFTKLLNDYGCKTKAERGRRLFPLSDHASDVTKALSNAMSDLGVNILLSTKATSIIVQNETCKGVLTDDKKRLDADHVIVATGGLSYPSTGSTGDGFTFAKDLGLKISPLRPALVPFECEGETCQRLQGLSLKNINFSVALENDKIIYKDFGEMLFTHFGISGPVVLSASSFCGKYLDTNKLHAIIDLKPAIPREELDKRLLKIINEHPKRSFSRFFEGLLPSKLINEAILLSGIDKDKNLADITKEERKRILSLLKEFKLDITGVRGFNEAIITQGGIAVKQLDPKSMKVKKISGLSFAGEVLDIDALTGGFNIQCAVSMGYLAGGSI
ncbi:MAG: NAD(P)/FAD-dependent oxidoreductase [Lachnospiraceae bacterium]|nr:NAD(P)/FAD-dependent oxidoreductase [Lachnospiraceae bacterium]